MSEGSYSQLWFDTFLHSIDPVQTRREADFIARQLPLPRYTRLLDICCGAGRHAAELARAGYRVTGFDLNAAIIEHSTKNNIPRSTFLVCDLRRTRDVPGEFDAAVLLWQSFGQFDEATNSDVLCQVACKLPPRGRFILDIYHRAFFERRQGTLKLDRAGRSVTETKRMRGNRLSVRLEYDGGGRDEFEWQLYMPEEMIEHACAAGFDCVLFCTDFNESRPATADRPRIQYVFEKR